MGSNQSVAAVPAVTSIGRSWPISVIVLPPIAGFTLMADRKHQDSILIFLKAVERYIAGTSSRDYQLPQAMLDRSADQWMTNQQLDCFLDQSHRLDRRHRICLDQKVGEPFKIGECMARIG